MNQLIARFNSAASLFSQGQVAEALEAYQNLFAPDASCEIEAPSEAFCLEVRLRIAFCLIELGDLTEARFEFESESFRKLLSFAGPAQGEAYFFAFGNLVARMGDYEAADQLLQDAQSIALNDLKDLGSVDRICRFRLHWANHFAHWNKLYDLAVEFRAIATENGLVALMHWSSEASCFALRGLHQYAEAKNGAQSILNRLQKAGARSEHLAVWTQFISELSA